jgi:hypothetical protein
MNETRLVISTSPVGGDEFEIELEDGFAVLDARLKIAPPHDGGDGEVRPDVLTVHARLWTDGMDIADGDVIQTVAGLALVLGVENDLDAIKADLRERVLDRWVGGAERASELALAR